MFDLLRQNGPYQSGAYRLSTIICEKMGEENRLDQEQKLLMIEIIQDSIYQFTKDHPIYHE